MDFWVLDVGATTFNLLRARVVGGQVVEREEYERWVRLGEGTLLSGVIAPDAWNGALNGIEALLACAKSVKPELMIGVATSVLREAENAAAFRKTLHVLYGLRVRVLSPAEEATLAFRGVQSALEQTNAPLLVIDLGGGCVNFALARSAGAPQTSTLSLGTMRLLPAFAPEGLLSRDDAGAVATLVRRSLALNSLPLHDRGATTVALCSGAARAVRSHACRHGAQPGPTGPLARAEVVASEHALFGRSARELTAAGVPADDAESLTLATTLVRAILDELALEQVWVVDRGLREGVALEEAARAALRLHV